MHPDVAALSQTDLRMWLDSRGLQLAPNIEGLREQQVEALDWIMQQRAPYLFINAPTGSGKTLLNGIAGCLLGSTWSYGVHTIALQEQVTKTFTNLPVIKGRANFECLIGEETHGRLVKASEAICASDQWCEHSGRDSEDGEPATFMCDYYAQRARAMQSPHRAANYAMIINQARGGPFVSMLGRGRSNTLLADEAHNIEDVVASQVSFDVQIRTFHRLGVEVPRLGRDLGAWRAWAEDAKERLEPVPHSRRGGPVPDRGLVTAHKVLGEIMSIPESDQGKWLIEEKGGQFPAVQFYPVWGTDHVMPWLFGHSETPESMDVFERGEKFDPGVKQVVMTSATLMGAEFVAEVMGLPPGSWAYLDLPSTFPIKNRPIMYAPVDRMSAASTATLEGRAKMQEAMDKLIDFYVLNGKTAGVIHSVSNRYRDQILQESRWMSIMTSSTEEHEGKVRRGLPSVLVAANVSEGWDGVDGLCRFVLMPKVPFPNLGDERTRIRKEEEPRSFDHKALVAVVQGAGRGVRHERDYADTWILDGNWRMLYSRAAKNDWLPDAFMSAYHHGVTLPG